MLPYEKSLAGVVNKVDLKKVGCSTPLHLTSCLTYLLSYSSLLKRCSCLGTVRHGPVIGRKAADARAV